MGAQCGGCDAQWGGLNRCHCSRCHLTFSGIGLFDKHQHYNKCKDPRYLKKKDGTPVMRLEDGIWKTFEDYPLELARRVKKVKKNV